MNTDLVQRTDLESIAWPDYRCRAVFFYDSRTEPGETGFQCVAVKDLHIYPAAGAAKIDLPHARRLRSQGSARQTPYVRAFQARERRKMKRLKFRRRLGVGVAI